MNEQNVVASPDEAEALGAFADEAVSDADASEATEEALSAAEALSGSLRNASAR